MSSTKLKLIKVKLEATGEKLSLTSGRFSAVFRLGVEYFSGQIRSAATATGLTKFSFTMIRARQSSRHHLLIF